MSYFTTEALVREKCQLTDTEGVPGALIERNIADAHGELARELRGGLALEPPPDALVLGATLLAGARTLESLASSGAYRQRRLALGNKRIEPGGRLEALLNMAALFERRAWEALEPFIRAIPARAPLAPSASAPVLGEEAPCP